MIIYKKSYFECMDGSLKSYFKFMIIYKKSYFECMDGSLKSYFECMDGSLYPWMFYVRPTFRYWKKKMNKRFKRRIPPGVKPLYVLERTLKVYIFQLVDEKHNNTKEKRKRKKA